LSRFIQKTRSRELTGSPSQIEYRPRPDDDPSVRRPDLARAPAELGWQPETPLAEGLAHPERVIGLHYFYHPAKNRLVEVIAGKDSDPAVVRRAVALGRHWLAQQAEPPLPARLQAG